MSPVVRRSTDRERLHLDPERCQQLVRNLLRARGGDSSWEWRDGLTLGMDIRQVNLNLLVAMNALFGHRNVTRAAAEIGLTQSAMSGELRRLRALFGNELLVRVGREYQLTPLANELVGMVADIVVSIERTLARRLTFDPATDERSFSIAMSDYVMIVLIEPLLRRIGRSAPGVALHIHPLEPDAVNTMLRPGGMDMVISVYQEAEAEVCHMALFSDRYVCVVRADHPQVGDEMTLELFRSLPCLQWGLGPDHRELCPGPISGEQH